MTKTSLTISGTNREMASAEVKQNLASLYKVSEEHFDELCHSLFELKKPYVLLKKIDQSVAEAHIKRLTELGFECSTASVGLTLVPVTENKAADIDCPACDQPSGNEEICQNCGVIIEKYAAQKKFDDQFQAQMKSTSNSNQRMKEIHAERIENEKASAEAKKKVKQEKQKKGQNADDISADSPSNGTSNDGEIPRVVSNEKTSFKVYAAVASCLVALVGGSYILYGIVNSKTLKDELVVAELNSNSETSSPGISSRSGAQLSTEAAAAHSTSADQASVNKAKLTNYDKMTVFGQRLERRRELNSFKQQITRLFEKDQLISASGLVYSKEEFRDRLFGQQELIKLEGLQDDSDEKMERTMSRARSLDSKIDRVDALLNQAAIYTAFDLKNGADKIYDQAVSVANNIDIAEERVIAETAIAEHHLLLGSQYHGRARYEIAKEKAAEIRLARLQNSAYRFIAKSQSDQGLTEDAELTIEQFLNDKTQNTLPEQANGIANLIQSSEISENAPQVGAAKSSGNTGDPMLDELVEMTEQNQLKLKAASGLLGQ